MTNDPTVERMVRSLRAHGVEYGTPEFEALLRLAIRSMSVEEVTAILRGEAQPRSDSGSPSSTRPK